jgi:peptide/nickel transport system permease protein
MNRMRGGRPPDSLAREREAERYYVASSWTLMRRKFVKHRLAVVAWFVLAILYAAAAFAGFAAPYDRIASRTDFSMAPPTRVRILHEGRLQAPFIYGLTRQRNPETLLMEYQTDPEQRHRIRLFVSGDEYKVLGLLTADKHLFGVEEPGVMFLFGTDQLGRDLFVRSLVGLRNGLGIAAAAVAIMFVVGCALGVISGYWGRWVDIILMRITDAQLSIPVIVLAITILSVSRPNAFTVTAVLVLAGWPIYARVVRSIALAEREREYVRGAKILGASDLRIAALMISPNILPPIAFVAVLDIARMMIFEALFGFLGIGIQPPTPTFGNIIADGYKYLVNSWWIPTMPGVFLILTLISINLMGASLERARNKLFKGIV